MHAQFVQILPNIKLYECICLEITYYHSINVDHVLNLSIFSFFPALQFMESLIREFPVIEVSIRTSSKKLRSVLDVFYQVITAAAAAAAVMSAAAMTLAAAAAAVIQSFAGMVHLL